MRTISEIAGFAYDQFERKSRENGDDFYSVKDGAPDWITDLVHDAHGSMLPDDWKYDAIHSVLGSIHDAGAETADDLQDTDHEIADGLVDTYNADRVRWLASHLDRGAYCDEAAKEFGTDYDGDTVGIYDLIGAGQYMEAREIVGEVINSLREYMEEHEDEDEETDD